MEQLGRHGQFDDDDSADLKKAVSELDTPEKPKMPEKKIGNPLMIVVLLAVLGAGGAVAYLKFFKKAQRQGQRRFG